MESRRVQRIDEAVPRAALWRIDQDDDVRRVRSECADDGLLVTGAADVP